MQEHRVPFGASEPNSGFPRNTQSRNFLRDAILLLALVIRREICTFYSVYFIVIIILEAFPDVSTSSFYLTLIPFLAVLGIEAAVQIWDLWSTRRALQLDDTNMYSIWRYDHSETIFRNGVCPGDIIEIDAGAYVPCDCVLVSSSDCEVLIDTSKIDGETESKSKMPVECRGETRTLANDVVKRSSGLIRATNPMAMSPEVSGVIELVTRPGDGNQVQQLCDITEKSFIERGSLIESTGTHLLVALYTGKHCRSHVSVAISAGKKTMIDEYVENLSLFTFVVQLGAALAIGGYGYMNGLNNHVDYIPDSYSIVDRGAWRLVVLVVRNFLLLSMMIPITLKFLLPIFRLIYGLFISRDNHFRSFKNDCGAKTMSTNMTENLGAIDAIVTDKTGTLTRNDLRLVTVSVGEKQYGCRKKAATLYVDDDLEVDWVQARQHSDSKLRMMFMALSSCHSIKENQNADRIAASVDDMAIFIGLETLGWRASFNGRVIDVTESPLGPYTIEVLKVNSFNSERKRMSAVVKLDDHVYCVMKGAPEEVKRLCMRSTEAMEARSDEYISTGLRALCVSYKDYGNDTSCQGLDVDELESEHELLGTIGSEDVLQQDAQLTIELLSGAEIKIWVATGDARGNTVVVANSLRLLRPHDDVIDVDRGDLQMELMEDVSNDSFSVRMGSADVGSFSTLVRADDHVLLGSALKNEAFVRALFRSRCVIFYRCKPQTKQDIAIALQNIDKKVLAVGDGENDTNLLSVADVGVGIFGKDGQRSFSNCHFALPSFRDLGRLILVHGHTALHRSVLALNFSFYKAVMFASVQMLFQLWTDGTAQSFFDGPSLTAYNNLWTLIPMFSLLFEKDVSENFLYRISSLYTDLKNRNRNHLKFALSSAGVFMSAIYQGMITLVVVYFLTGEAFLDDSGRDYGSTYLSLIVYTSLVLSCAFYMAYQTNTFTYYSLILIVGNVNLLIATTACLQSENFLSEFLGSSWTGFYGDCFNQLSTLIILATTFLASVMPAWVFWTAYGEIRPPAVLPIIEIETTAAQNDMPLVFDPTAKK